MRRIMTGAIRRQIPSLLLLLLVPAALRAQEPAPRSAPPKLAPGLSAAAPAVRVSVSDPAAFRQWARQHLPAARVSQPTAAPRLLNVTGLDATGVSQLAASPLVDFVDVPDRPAHEERRLSNSDLTVNAIAAVHARFPSLTGQGLTASVKEQPFDPTDIDLQGRVLTNGTFPGPPSDHATAMATLLGGAGNSDPLGRGVARAVRLATADFARLLPDDAASLTPAGISVQNHSYGVGIENYYGVEAQAYDQQVQQLPTLLHVFSSGNVGTQASATGPYQGLPNFANLSGQFKMSKNTLTVGATDPSGQVAALSSRGPAYDGRVKPELVAYGEGGSSEAAALVSGLSVLLQQAYRDQHGNTLPSAALVKAVLLNSADDLGRPEVDFLSGFGQLDALGAVNTMRDGRFWEGTVGQGAEQVFTLAVSAGQQQLKITLTWTDPAAVANAGSALVNDLDLELVAVGSGQRWQPWGLSPAPHPDSLAQPARRRPDHLNNVEQITVALPAAGTYQVRVRGYAVPQGPQAFSLAYETNAPGLTWASPGRPDNLRPGATNTLRWQWSGPTGSTARLEYRPVGRSGWQLLSSSVVLAQRSFAWTAPDTTALVQFRLVAGSGAFTSDTVALVRPPAVRVGYACADEALLQWPRVPGATGYQVYQLGATRLVPFAHTADTAVVLTGPQLAVLYYAVAPIVGGRVAGAGSTVNYTTQGTACYFRSFLPRQLVDETLGFDVELGSVFRLRAATLERLGPGGYEPVQTIQPLTQPRFSFTDLPPVPGRYLYRVRLDHVAGPQFYSAPEEAFRLRAGGVQAYPNPVPAGQPLLLVANTSAPIAISLYDLLGRLQRQAVVNGIINPLATEGLKPGLYLLRVRLENQAEQTLRVVLQ